MPVGKTVELGNTPINNICRNCMLIHHSSSLIHALRSFITIVHSTWHLVGHQPPAQANDFQAMGHSGKDKTSRKVVMACLQCSSLCIFQRKGHHLQVQRECLQDCQVTIQSIGLNIPALLLFHLDRLPAQQGDPPLASRQNYSSLQWDCRQHMSLELQTWPHCWRSPTMNVMHMMRAMISWAWVVLKASPQSACSKQNSPWSNLPKGWGRPTTVRSTSERKYGWPRFLRRNIGSVSGGRTIWNRFELDPWAWGTAIAEFLVTF